MTTSLTAVPDGPELVVEPGHRHAHHAPHARPDAHARLAAARAALTRAETAAGLRTRLGGPGLSTSPVLTGEPGLSVPAPPVTGPPLTHPAAGSGAHRSAVPDPDLFAPGADRSLPVPQVLAPVFPGGALARGSVVQVSGSTSVLLALAAAAATDGAWCALAAMPDVGWRAAAGAGLALDRVAVVPAPGPDAAAVVGALTDGFDVLVVGRCPALGERDRRSIAARVRTRGAVLLSTHDWPGAHLVLRATRSGWEGLGQGWGHLVDQELTVRATGRAGAAVAREVHVRVGPDGLGGVGEVPAAGARPDDEARTADVRPLLRAV
ncbi:hypothetical protein KZX45_16850 [Georgenia sp. EYE_87]|uniref:hypothetical protein n=1 Tax=Georgenia sp. EYE_87 TaxID=2853448 RepID=UPI0020068B19|nr:hypothetical protein [Georgenia sp. EYE_87]MCK6212213.1 hypothetical protein [Georgenia sp. EYE_87]